MRDFLRKNFSSSIKRATLVSSSSNDRGCVILRYVPQTRVQCALSFEETPTGKKERFRERGKERESDGGRLSEFVCVCLCERKRERERGRERERERV